MRNKQKRHLKNNHFQNSCQFQKTNCLNFHVNAFRNCTQFITYFLKVTNTCFRYRMNQIPFGFFSFLRNPLILPMIRFLLTLSRITCVLLMKTILKLCMKYFLRNLKNSTNPQKVILFWTGSIYQGWPNSLIVRAIFQNLKFFASCN